MYHPFTKKNKGHQSIPVPGVSSHLPGELPKHQRFDNASRCKFQVDHEHSEVPSIFINEISNIFFKQPATLLSA